jgi:hypothetical protein
MAMVFGVAATIAAEEAGRLAAPAVSEPIDRRYLGQEVAGWEAPLVARVEIWSLYERVRAGPPLFEQRSTAFLDGDREFTRRQIKEQEALKAAEEERQRRARAAWGVDGPIGLWSLPSTTKKSHPQGHYVPSVTSLKTGWPLRVAGYELCEEMEAVGPRPAATWSRVLVHERTIATGEKFGTRPLPFGGLFRFWLVPRGVVGDIAFFGGAFMAASVLARCVRMWWRRRHGACAGCGYALEGMPRCPECGEERRTTRMPERGAAIANQPAEVSP